ncbi:MAG: hypothetical protein II863_05550 [Kiritimatiellae bacterium]|nr:hypothetical protein [Kiritimatiellia bacterium]
MNTISKKIAAVLIGGGVIASSAFAAITPQQATWVGGASGEFTIAANWDPATVPNNRTSTKAYIVTFTNSTTVTLSTSSDYWYSGGIVVKDGANVVCTGTGTYRFYPTTADIGGDGDGGTNLVIDVESGSSLTFDGVVMRGLETVTLVKTGGGTFTTTRGIGNSYGYRNVDVREGVLDSSTTTVAYNLVPKLTIRDGAVFKTSVAGGIAKAENPSVTIEAGGIYDAGGKALTLAHLSGAGAVSNLTTLTVSGVGEMAASDVFSGRIYGNLSIVPTAGTPAGSSFFVGASDTLAKSDLAIDTSACPTYELKFAAGIGKFLCKSFPAGVTFYDTDGKEVLLANAFWYVDPARATSGDGTSVDTAFATLSDAMTNPLLESSDVVYALPGRYERGTMTASAGNVETNRVIVPAGVRLFSTKGAESTLIIGAPSSNPVAAGCGAGAVRCVVLGAGSVLRGFTVTNGFTYCVSATSGAYYGGGITGSGTDSIVEDCVVTGCSAVRGGGVNEVLCRRCTFLKNDTSYIGTAARRSEFYNCLFSGHTTGSYVTLYSSAVNCSFLSDNVNVVATWTDNKDDSTIYFKNCLFLCKAGRDVANYQSCAFAIVDGQVSDGNIGESSFRRSRSELLVKAGGMPKRLSPLIDAGSDDLYPKVAGGELDCLSACRIYGDHIDIGAYEWRQMADGFIVIVR